ncbi:zona pellucida sperm-binding protein 4 [Salvelinus namaycush]|uniref:Zona pellucida sperm-binding protein 4 n=1 Tax=Salvelinus namaycush TaxID=8040 RepID=A0A8U0PLS7_SALNM|nr:zona pellucida sperm-binding protein 4 [Salvelinus namaycush]
MDSSPAQRLMAQRLKAALPVASTLLEPCVVTDVLVKLRHRRHVSKFIYDKSAKDLPELRVCETVRMKPLLGDRTGLWRLGSCVQKVAPRSYLVKVNGSLYCRNRVDLRIAEPAPTQNSDGHRGHMTKDGTPASHMGHEAVGEEPGDHRLAAPSPINTPLRQSGHTPVQFEEESDANKWVSVTEAAPVSLAVLCGEEEFKVTLPAGPMSEVKILGPNSMLSVLEAPESCGYSLYQNVLTVSFSGCLIRRCSIPQNQHLACGSTGISSSQCLVMGCCVDSATSACFYPMDECTADKQFIFAVHHDITTFPVTPTKLVVAGKSRCGPVIVNDKFVVFKFSVTECGTRSYEIGGTVIYTAEVQTAVRTLNLKFGIISRDNPLRVMVECRYPKALGTLPTAASVGYMVKSPSVTFPSKVTSKGLFGVELRIAEDKTYTKYLKRHHQPLHLILGKLVYLEVRLTSPNPQATLLVNYCLAYPRSAKNVLVLIHEGCANPQDPNVSILKFSNLPQNRHQRRFMIQAFQFMDQRTNKYLDEEIYFMCSTEVCMPTEKTCEERCFDATRR